MFGGTDGKTSEIDRFFICLLRHKRERAVLISSGKSFLEHHIRNICRKFLISDLRDGHKEP